MKKALLLCIILSLLATLCFAAQNSSETLLRREPIPAEPPYQGEVRLIRRGTSLVMQTILDSKVLKHVIGAIRKKELLAWPEDKDGWVDSRRYTNDLFRAYEIVKDHAKGSEGSKDRHLKLLIEFVLEERHSYVALYEPTLAMENDHYSIEGKKLLKKLKTSRAYTFNNMQEIARDSFRLEANEVRELLKPIPGGL